MKKHKRYYIEFIAHVPEEYRDEYELIGPFYTSPIEIVQCYAIQGVVI